MKKILVVDDADFILETTAAILKFEGYEVYTAENGKLALNLAKVNQPDLILSDVSMPEIDGFELLEQFKNDDLLKRIPFIFLTAFADKSNIRLGMEKGADDYLIKPFTRDELIASINAQFKKYQIVELQYEEKVTRLNKSIITSLPHEFRTVLNQISGTTKFLNLNHNKVKPDEILELTNDILKSAERLNKITENYLIYSRLESFILSNDKLNLKEFKTDEPLAMIYDIGEMIAGKFNRLNDLLIKGDIENIYLQVSTESFYKVLNELLDNAFNFSKINSKVEIIVSQIDENFLKFCIIDKGRGMSKQQTESIGVMIQFERDVYEQQGIGLGLAISKKIVELHDGLFSIESEVGYGTKVTFTLPYKKNIN